MISCIWAFCVKGLREVEVKHVCERDRAVLLKVTVPLFQVHTSSNHDDSHIEPFWGSWSAPDSILSANRDLLDSLTRYIFYESFLSDSSCLMRKISQWFEVKFIFFNILILTIYHVCFSIIKKKNYTHPPHTQYALYTQILNYNIYTWYNSVHV